MLQSTTRYAPDDVGKKTERQSRAVEQLPAVYRYIRDLRRKR
jgi:hypothetical protein